MGVAAVLVGQAAALTGHPAGPCQLRSCTGAAVQAAPAGGRHRWAPPSTRACGTAATECSLAQCSCLAGRPGWAPSHRCQRCVPVVVAAVAAEPDGSPCCAGSWCWFYWGVLLATFHHVYDIVVRDWPSLAGSREGRLGSWAASRLPCLSGHAGLSAQAPQCCCTSPNCRQHVRWTWPGPGDGCRTTARVPSLSSTCRTTATWRSVPASTAALPAVPAAPSSRQTTARS